MQIIRYPEISGPLHHGTAFYLDGPIVGEDWRGKLAKLLTEGINPGITLINPCPRFDGPGLRERIRDWRRPYLVKSSYVLYLGFNLAPMLEATYYARSLVDLGEALSRPAPLPVFICVKPGHPFQHAIEALAKERPFQIRISSTIEGLAADILEWIRTKDEQPENIRSEFVKYIEENKGAYQNMVCGSWPTHPQED